ncbi:MAG: helix-turn-helix domain-containing protein [Bacteroidia bacterium]
MTANYFKISLALLMSVFVVGTQGYAKADLDESQVKVAMRMIGHKLLLQSGDSVSRVLAVEREEERYKIELDTEFQFDPAKLVVIINDIVIANEIAQSYLVEVEDCGSKKVIYSYQMGGESGATLIPCGGRKLPQNCYKIFFTSTDPKKSINTALANNSSSFSFWGFALLLIISFVGFSLYRKRGRSKTTIRTNPDMILIGDYSYDKKSMILSHKGIETELSSKEADLLLLLFTAENKVLERENILKVVWGDKGDYVGRTLDVFISKLRKKLAADPKLKIVNIRGIGYKFVMQN